MSEKKEQRMWVYKSSPPKFNKKDKENILAKIKEIIPAYPKVSAKVTRIEMRANRIYLYEMVEQINPEGTVYLKPLVEGKYLEYPYARITMLDAQGEKCTADFQRHNNQWMTLYNGTLSECIAQIEADDAWF